MKQETDILVLGSGAAGMMASIIVSEKGKRCIVLEKGSHIAVSNAARAGGPALADTDIQKKENACVSEETLFEHMYRFSRGTINGGLLRNAISKSREVERIFRDCRIGLGLLEDHYEVGFRARHCFLDVGAKRWNPLVERLKSLGGVVMFNRQALAIEKGEKRKFCVRAIDPKCKDNTYVYEADQVIVATGGYLGNQEMIKKHLGNVQVVPLGNTLSDGAGIQMLSESGAALTENWGICTNEFGGANSKAGKSKTFTYEMRFALSGGLLVNRFGKRFMNEQILSDYPLSIGGAQILQEGVFYAVLDHSMYMGLKDTRFYEFYGSPSQWNIGKNHEEILKDQKSCGIEQAIKEKWCFKGSLKEIAKQADLCSLAETVEMYNKICYEKKDKMFGKAEFLLVPLEQEPFYVFEYEPSAWCTLGGVKTDECCRVINKDNQIMEGLFAAGIDNGSCYTSPYYDNEGAALGLALTTGIVAGESAAEG